MPKPLRDGARRESASASPLLAAARDAYGHAQSELKNERLPEASAHFTAALRKLPAGEDASLEARILAGLAAVAVELADVRALERVRKAVAKMTVPGGRTERFVLATALRSASLLANDIETAYFEAREATFVASTPAEHALAETNAAVVSGLLGDRSAEKLQFGRAFHLLRSGQWAAGDDGARIAFLTFVSEAARSLPSEARKALASYRAFVPKANPSAVEGRMAAFEAFASGRLADAVGDEITAERFYEKALATFADLRLDLRAALVALDLRRISGDDSYDSRVQTVLDRAPDAWFGAEFSDRDGPLERLSPAELVVLAHLLRGDTAKAIGEKLDRSPFTISNHTRRIFQAFEVNSRSKVIAMCAERGVTPEHVERLVR